jgi:hypothetical protein
MGIGHQRLSKQQFVLCLMQRLQNAQQHLQAQVPLQHLQQELVAVKFFLFFFFFYISLNFFHTL